ncbi:MAG: hypothetical protein JXR63_00205 [Spirochaetales bacterium]|nr:hypothetical protein [Spirochaetales bacterium]
MKMIIFKISEILREVKFILEEISQTTFALPERQVEEIFLLHSLYKRSDLLKFSFEWFKGFQEFYQFEEDSDGFSLMRYGISILEEDLDINNFSDKTLKDLDFERFSVFRDGLLLFYIALVDCIEVHYRIVTKISKEELFLMFFSIDRDSFSFLPEESFLACKFAFLRENLDLPEPNFSSTFRVTNQDSYLPFYEEPAEFDEDLGSQYMNDLRYQKGFKSDLKFAYLKVEEEFSSEVLTKDYDEMSPEEFYNFYKNKCEEESSDYLNGSGFLHTDYTKYGYPDFSNNLLFQRICYVRNKDYQKLLNDVDSFYRQEGFEAVELAFFSCEVAEHLNTISSFLMEVREKDKSISDFSEKEFLNKALEELIESEKHLKVKKEKESQNV